MTSVEGRLGAFSCALVSTCRSASTNTNLSWTTNFNDSSSDSDQAIEDFYFDLSESPFAFDPLELPANGNADAGFARQPVDRHDDW